jgi:hypothetical protein
MYAFVWIDNLQMINAIFRTDGFFVHPLSMNSMNVKVFIL